MTSVDHSVASVGKPADIFGTILKLERITPTVKEFKIEVGSDFRFYPGQVYYQITSENTKNLF